MKLGNVQKAVLVGFSLRVSLVFYGSEVGTLRQSSDAFGYLRKAKELSRSHDAGLLAIFDPEAGLLVYFGSLVYGVTERAPILLGLLMAILGSGIIYIAYRSALQLWENEKAARTVAWGVACFPQLALHSALFLKEIPISFCLTAAAYCAIRYGKYNKVNSLIGYFIWIAFATLFHSAMIVAMPALVIGMILIRPHRGLSLFSVYARNAFSVVILAGILFVVNRTSIGLEKFGGSLDGAVEVFESREMRDTEGSAGYPQWLRIRGGLADVWKVPIRFVALVFSPLLPFMVRSSAHLLGALDAVLYILLFWNMFSSWSYVKSRRPALVILIVTMSLYLLFSLGVSNFGTAIRHRSKMSPLLLIVAAGLPEINRQARSRRGRGQGWQEKVLFTR